jgi:hypothetical protein
MGVDAGQQRLLALFGERPSLNTLSTGSRETPVL